MIAVTRHDRASNGAKVSQTLRVCFLPVELLGYAYTRGPYRPAPHAQRSAQ